MAKIGRNSLCPCGSGKKYKRCCERRETEMRKSEAPAGRTRYEPGSYGDAGEFFPSLLCYKETEPDLWEEYYCLVKLDVCFEDQDSATSTATSHLEAAFAAMHAGAARSMLPFLCVTKATKSWTSSGSSLVKMNEGV